MEFPIYPSGGEAQRADLRLLLIEGLALCDQCRAELSVYPGDGKAQRADSGLLLTEGLAFAISAGQGFPCARALRT